MTAAGGLSDALTRLAGQEDRQPEPQVARSSPAQQEPEIELRSAEAMKSDETTILTVEQIIAEGQTETPAKPAHQMADDSPASARQKRRPRATTRPTGKSRSRSTSRATTTHPTTRSSGSTRRTASTSRASRATAGNLQIKRTAVPILLTVGGLMLIPTVWAVLILAGFDVLKHDDPKARQVAWAMLTTFPISLCLIAGAIYFWVQTNKQLARQKKPARR